MNVSHAQTVHLRQLRSMLRGGLILVMGNLTVVGIERQYLPSRQGQQSLALRKAAHASI